jgi:cytochrome c biogenesis protein CcdA
MQKICKLKGIKELILISLLGIGLISAVFSANAKEEIEVSPVRLYLFYSDTCLHCHDEIAFLEKIKKDLPFLEVHSFELSNNSDTKTKSLFSNVLRKYNLEGSVPVTIIGEEFNIVGFDNEKGVGQDIKDVIKKCSLEACDSWLDKTVGVEPASTMPKINTSLENFEKVLGIITDVKPVDTEKNKREVTVFGMNLNIDSGMPILLLGIILGFVDGVNPCMLSILLFLLSYLLAIGSRKKAIQTGIVFVVTTFLLYFFFMYGIFKIVDTFELAGIARGAIIAISFILGTIMLKDFFYYGKWISLEIPEKYKPIVEKLIKRGTIPSAIVLAIFSGIVEAPCTAGLPLAYTTALTDRNIQPFWYIAWYNIFFVMPLLIVVGAVVFSWAKAEKMEKVRTNFKKYMRLVSGVLLILLAIAFLAGWL